MKNDKNVKQVSRLTGALLAKKGTAAPVQTSLVMNQSASRFFTSQQDETRVASKKLAQADNKENNKAGNGQVSTKKSGTTKSSKERAVNRRIAMTLRMEEENHLKLRIFSAHTRKSCQVILSEALDIYLTENGDKISPLKFASHNG